MSSYVTDRGWKRHEDDAQASKPLLKRAEVCFGRAHLEDCWTLDTNMDGLHYLHYEMSDVHSALDTA